MRDKEVEDVRARMTEVAEIFERKDIKQKYSFDVLCDFIYDKAKRLFSKYDHAVKELKVLNSGDKSQQHLQRRLELLEGEHEDLKQVLVKNNQLANELTNKFLVLIGDAPTLPSHVALYDKEDGVERFRLIAGKVEINFLQVRQENSHLKERISDLIKQIEFFQQNSDFTNKEKERRRFEMREDQARRELEHVKKEKEKLVDKNAEMALALKQAHDELRQIREEADRLKDKVIFYEKTFPMTLTRHKKQFVVPPININSEPTQHNERHTTPDTSTANTGKNRAKDYSELIVHDKYSEKTHYVRGQLNNPNSMHSSIGTSKKHLTDAEANSVAMRSEERSSQMKGPRTHLRSDSSDQTDDEDMRGRSSKRERLYDQRGSRGSLTNEGFY